MIDQKEGETEMAVKVHYDNMVKKKWSKLDSSVLMLFTFYRYREG